MTSIEVPRRLAALLPTLSVMDISEEVQAAVTESGKQHGIAFLGGVGTTPCCVRVNELEQGFFADVEACLGRVVPESMRERERLILLLLGGRGEQVPFSDGKLSLGTWQRVLLFGFGPRNRGDWRVTLLGE